jgi:hypothetical protein
MSTTVNSGGRFGNQFIRNIALSLLAEKHDLLAIYSDVYIENTNNKCIVNDYTDIDIKLGVKFFSGKNNYHNVIILDDDNYFNIYNEPTINYNLNLSHHYFQSKEIINLIFSYLNSGNVKKNIMDVNPYNYRYNNNNDIIIHIRLTDVADYNPGAHYYLKAIELVYHDTNNMNIYITTDDKHHSIIQEIIEKYNIIQFVEYDEINTIQFASTCKNVILSHGTFSAVIGYLSFFSNVYYPEFNPLKEWCPSGTVIDTWTKISHIL